MRSRYFSTLLKADLKGKVKIRKIQKDFSMNYYFKLGAIHKRRRNILGGGGSEIPMLQEIRR